MERVIMRWYLGVLVLITSNLFGAGDVVREHVTFYSKKNESSNEWMAREGLLTRRPDAQATVVILHGYGGDKTEVGPLRLMLKKYNVMTFDFRAHGKKKSEQQSTIGHDEVYDVFGAVDYIRSQPDLKNKPIIGFGLSMGAATAIEAQALDPNLFTALFLDTPFSSSEDVLHKVMDHLMHVSVSGYEFDIPGRNLLEKYAFNSWVQWFIQAMIKFIARVRNINVETLIKPIFPIESAKKIKVPGFFVVCKNDEQIPVSDVMRVYENYAGIKRVLKTGGRRHCDTLFTLPELYKQVLNQFIQDVLSGDIYNQPKELVMEESGDDSHAKE